LGQPILLNNQILKELNEKYLQESFAFDSKILADQKDN